MSRQYPLPLPHREAMEADDFLVTSSNRDAVAWLERWPDWPGHCLVIHGPPGSGKTHLAEMWRRRSGALALDSGKLTDFEFRNSNILIDNADKVTGTATQEEALFHLFNRLRDTKSFLLLTAVHAPAQWKIGLADLRSRLASVPAASIATPDDELLSALLIKQFRDRQIDLAVDVVDYLLPRMERTPEAIRRLVQALDDASLAEGRRITVPMARKCMEDQGFLIS